MRLRMDRCGMVRTGCLQSHANYINIGEYRVEDCLPCRHDRWEGLALPIVQHRDSGYTAKSRRVQYADDDGVQRTRDQRFWCQQEGYPLPTVQPKFHASSGSSSSSGGVRSKKSRKTQSSIEHFLLTAPQARAAE